MEDKPMTAEEFYKKSDFKLSHNYQTGKVEIDYSSIIELMQAYKDSHTSPLLAEIESLKKEVERLNKRPNSEDVKRWFQLLIGKSNDHMEADIAEFYHSNQ